MVMQIHGLHQRHIACTLEIYKEGTCSLTLQTSVNNQGHPQSEMNLGPPQNSYATIASLVLGNFKVVFSAAKLTKDSKKEECLSQVRAYLWNWFIWDCLTDDKACQLMIKNAHYGVCKHWIFCFHCHNIAHDWNFLFWFFLGIVHQIGKFNKNDATGIEMFIFKNIFQHLQCQCN